MVRASDPSTFCTRHDNAIHGRFAHTLAGAHRILTRNNDGLGPESFVDKPAHSRPSFSLVKLLPPLNITEDDAEWFLDGFEKTMEALHRFPGPVWELVKKLGKHAVAARV